MLKDSPEVKFSGLFMNSYPAVIDLQDREYDINDISEMSGGEVKGELDFVKSDRKDSCF